MNGNRFTGSVVFRVLAAALAVATLVFALIGVHSQFFADDPTAKPKAAVTDDKPTKPKGLIPATITGNETKDDRQTKDQFNNYLLGNPALKCADGRNDGLTWADIKKIRPCVNGSIHVRLKDGKLTLINSSIDDTTIVLNGATVDGDEKDGELGNNNWTITPHKHVDTITQDDGTKKTETSYRLDYDRKESFESFVDYAKVGDGAWETQTNLNDYSWPADKTVDFVLTWRDPNLPMTDAPVPFDWSEVSKHYYMAP